MVLQVCVLFSIIIKSNWSSQMIDFFIFTVKTNYIPYAKFHVFIKELYFTR